MTGNARPDERSQTALIGVILLVGLVAIAGLGILLVGTTANQYAQNQVNEEKVENSFRVLDETIDSVAESDAAVRKVVLDLPRQSDAAVRREDTGKIVINRTNLTTTKTIVVKKIGSITFQRGGTHYAYQSGAVWRGQGNSTRLVSAPPIRYGLSREGTAPTLTLPVVDLQGPRQLDPGKLRVKKRLTVSPLNDAGAIDEQLVVINVTSDYYVGWGEYFEQRFPELTTVTYHHADQKVSIKLGKRDIDGNYSDAISTYGDLSISGGGSVSGPITVGGSVSGSRSCTDPDVECGHSFTMTPLDAVIARKIQTARDEYPDVTSALRSGGDTLTAGEYYTQGFELDGDTLTFDLQNGNVTLVVDGPIAMDGGTIRVENAAQNATCCYARIYLGGGPANESGDFASATGGGSNTEIYSDGGSTRTDNATRLQVYGTSEMQMDVGQANSGGYNMVVYAPHDGDAAVGPNSAVSSSKYPAVSLPAAAGTACTDDPDVCIGTGSSGFSGSIVGFYNASVTAGSSISFQPAVRQVEPTLGYSGVIPPPITFLHVSVHKVCVNDGGPCRDRPIGYPIAKAQTDPPSDDTIDEGTASGIDLDGTGSSDPDGSSLTYDWNVTSGPGSLTNDTTATPTYVPPGDVSRNRTVYVRLTVTDADGNESTAAVSLVVNDTDGNEAPTADLGGPYVVEEGLPVELDGTGSSDPDADSLEYRWSVVSDPTGRVTIEDAQTATPTFVAPDDQTGNVDVEVALNLTDGEYWDNRTVAVTIDNVEGNSPPDADAGGPYTVQEGGSVELDATGSTDPDGDSIEYAWTLGGAWAPPGSLSDEETATPVYHAPDDVNGDETVTVVVDAEDVHGGDDDDSVTITIVDTD